MATMEDITTKPTSITSIIGVKLKLDRVQTKLTTICISMKMRNIIVICWEIAERESVLENQDFMILMD